MKVECSQTALARRTDREREAYLSGFGLEMIVSLALSIGF